MARPKLLISKLLRYCRATPSFSSSSSPSLFARSHCGASLHHHLLTGSPNAGDILGFPSSTVHSQTAYSLSCFRLLSTRDASEHDGLIPDDDSAAMDQSELLSDLGFQGGADGSEISKAVLDEELIFPVRAVISLLDGYHDLTGLPWWIIIASSTLALRIALFPVLILQLHKLKKIAELFPRLPPPLPPPLSGRNYVDHISFFRKEKRAVGCPSYLWFLAYASVQVPCFLLWMTSIRRMSLDHHSGFDCGGTLWFHDLTEFPHGVMSPVFPLLIAGLHFVNVQMSFRSASVEKISDLFRLLAKWYKIYLNFLTVPIFFVGFCVPQGTLVYWVTNSTLTLIQQLSLHHLGVLKHLGLDPKGAPLADTNPGESGTLGVALLDPLGKQKKIYAQNLSPRELLALSVKLLSEGQKDRAIPLLRLAIDKDPGYVRALVVMGQTMMQNGLLAEATEYLERAISKLFLIGHPSEVEDVDLLILASQWAGVACIRQGKITDGILHLERVAHLNEPEDSKSKAHYYDGLVLFASALYNEGRKDEAAKYLRKAAAYNSAYNVYLEQCEKDEDDIVNDLVNSRRGDH